MEEHNVAKHVKWIIVQSVGHDAVPCKTIRRGVCNKYAVSRHVKVGTELEHV